MRATGMVRRIDDLGRVVIPKELRRNLRIREGDPLEIYTDDEGGVVFKKYSPIEELSKCATSCAEVLYKAVSLPVIICDRDHVIAVSGISKKEYKGRRITQQLEKLLQDRKNYLKNEEFKIFPVEGINLSASIINPVISSNGDIYGAIIILDNSENSVPDENNIKITQIVSELFSKYIEN